jgi:cation diffusion facilitator CzcD-associated flavoprotein CzcO
MDDVRVVIIGAGFGGLYAAIRFREEGIEDFVVLERDDEVGGTWRENTYPGCACDVPSHLYSFSFALNPEWSRSFAPQPEILDYLRGMADRVRDKIRVGAELESARWDEEEQRWLISTAQGDYRAQALVSATGALSQPKAPDVDGLDAFEGTMFHSAAWDHEHDLSGERVAVIGTGASSAQFIPHVQEQAAQMDVFQRTAPWVLPKPDFAHGPRTHRAFRRFPALQRAVRNGIYYFAESLVYGLARDQRALRPNEAMGRWLLRHQVKDPVLREKLSPDYRIGCKRIVFANNYFPALAAPNADVITDPISEVVADGIVTADGTHRRYDTILLGTGFRVFGQPTAERVFGRDGRSIREVWEPTGPYAYRGTAVAGFPNHFLIIGPNTGLGNNSMINTIEAQVEYVIDALRTMDRANLASVEVRPGAQDRHNEQIQEQMHDTVWTGGGCKSWYLTEDGVNRTLWPSYSNDFKRSVERFQVGDYSTVVAPAHERQAVG